MFREQTSLSGITLPSSAREWAPGNAGGISSVRSMEGGAALEEAQRVLRDEQVSAVFLAESPRLADPGGVRRLVDGIVTEESGSFGVARAGETLERFFGRLENELLGASSSPFSPGIADAAADLAAYCRKMGNLFAEVARSDDFQVALSIVTHAHLERVKHQARFLHVHRPAQLFGLVAPIDRATWFTPTENVDEERFAEFERTRPVNQRFKSQAYLAQWERALNAKPENAFFLRDPDLLFEAPTGCLTIAKGRGEPGLGEQQQAMKGWFHQTPPLEPRERRLLLYFEDRNLSLLAR